MKLPGSWLWPQAARRGRVQSCRGWAKGKAPRKSRGTQREAKLWLTLKGSGGKHLSSSAHYSGSAAPPPPTMTPAHCGRPRGRRSRPSLSPHCLTRFPFLTSPLGLGVKSQDDRGDGSCHPAHTIPLPQTGHDSPPALTCSPSTRIAAPLPRPKPSSPVARPEPPWGCPPKAAVSSAMTFERSPETSYPHLPNAWLHLSREGGVGMVGWEDGGARGGFPGRASL